ncbi:MAG: hypothetical protein LBR56_01615 [Sporomusaceae bacterium]|jgi:hypothetical protein|nr:hypothetical protein [Sporomusaceae bacterium]
MAQEENCPKVEFECPCTKTDCDNHGICCKCTANHRSVGKPVYCMREDVLAKPQ